MQKIVYDLLLKVAEPRAQRVLQWWVYLFLTIVGISIVASPPQAFQHIIGLTLVYSFGTFMVLGGIFGMIAVLPGIHWLERVAVIFLTTAILIYLVVVLSIGTTVLVVGVCMSFILTFVIRWFDIRGMLLAPKKE